MDKIKLSEKELMKILSDLDNAIQKRYELIYQFVDTSEIPLKAFQLVLSDVKSVIGPDGNDMEVPTGQTVNMQFIWREKKKELVLIASKSGNIKMIMTDFKADEEKRDGSISCRCIPQFKEHNAEIKAEWDKLIKSFGMDMQEFYNYFSYLGRIWLHLQFYLKHLPSSYTVSTEKVVEAVSVSKKNGKRKTGGKIYKQVVHLEKIYEMKAIGLKQIRATPIFKCPAWGVRGHYRHQKNKNGETVAVFVRPYVKGKERNNPLAYKEKEYVL